MESLIASDESLGLDTIAMDVFVGLLNTFLEINNFVELIHKIVDRNTVEDNEIVLRLSSH